MAEVFVRSGNKVIVCGRRKERLKEAKSKLPQIETIHCDVSKKDDCNRLFREITSKFKDFNVLTNNAGLKG